MTENTNIGLDFGVVKTDKTSTFDQIKRHMDSEGYNLEGSDVCSVRIQESDNEKEVVLFKFVHYSVPTAETEPFYKIEFHYSK